MSTFIDDRWQRIDDLLAAALDRPLDERTAFLREACADDLDLYSQVTTLLDGAEPAADFLGNSAADFAAPLLTEEEPTESTTGLKPGDRVGPYQIQEEIGRGGMGTVYRAHRADGSFEKEVALKLVKRGMDTDEVLARFRRERQVLAGLDHPGIARLLDGGAADDGRPYLVMEFVAGEPITVYCDTRRLSLEHRLALFEQVCEAVQHAHRRLVVHRDLKPSNILVTENEHGHVRGKLLDFGIARLLEDEADERLTQTGARRLTPAYAAPEQFRGEAVTTAADVYALGVVLYELLAGQRPDAPPMPPSAKADGDTTQRIRGDLDVLCLKALREDVAERYGSVEALLDDLRRWQSGRPITARPASVGYRMRKFIGRHRVGMAATALVIAALFIGLGVALWQAGIAARERDQAEEVTRFLSDLFTSTVPTTAPTDTTTARTLLAYGEERAQALTGQPVVQAQMLRVLGSAYLSLGRFDRAEPLLDQTLALSRAHLGAAHPDLAAALVERALLAYHTGDYALADSLDRQALAVLHRHYGYEHERVAEVLAALAVTHSEQGAYALADSLFRDALALYQRTGTDGQPDAVAALRNFAALRYREGDYAAADSLYERALTRLRSLYGPNHTQIALTLDNLGALRYVQGDPEAGLEITREAHAMWQHLLGDDHPSTLVSTSNLATFLMVTGDLEEAEALHRRVLSVRREQLGDAHPSIASTLNSLASVLRRQDRFGEAESLLREALAIQREALGDEHPGVAQSLNSLAHMEYLMGDLSGAEASYREALAMRRNLLGERHPDVALTQLGLADVLVKRRSFEAAEALYREALDICVDLLGETHPRTQQAQKGLDKLYDTWDRPTDTDR